MSTTTTKRNRVSAPPKRERNMKSWEADDDVTRMLDRVAARGIKLVFYVNQALRLKLLADGYGGKKDTAV